MHFTCAGFRDLQKVFLDAALCALSAPMNEAEFALKASYLLSLHRRGLILKHRRGLILSCVIKIISLPLKPRQEISKEVRDSG